MKKLLFLFAVVALSLSLMISSFAATSIDINAESGYPGNLPSYKDYMPTTSNKAFNSGTYQGVNSNEVAGTDNKKPSIDNAPVECKLEWKIYHINNRIVYVGSITPGMLSVLPNTSWATM